MQRRLEVGQIVNTFGIKGFVKVKPWVNDIERFDDLEKVYVKIKKETQKLNKAKIENRRVIAVGTTSVRTLESAAVKGMPLTADDDDTSIFIYPPYKFKVVDALITNFHLPKSTLIMLVSAFAGYENTMDLYETAVENSYRFFSFGDAMFIQ